MATMKGEEMENCRRWTVHLQSGQGRGWGTAAPPQGSESLCKKSASVPPTEQGFHPGIPPSVPGKPLHLSAFFPAPLWHKPFPLAEIRRLSWPWKKHTFLPLLHTGFPMKF